MDDPSAQAQRNVTAQLIQMARSIHSEGNAVLCMTYTVVNGQGLAFQGTLRCEWCVRIGRIRKARPLPGYVLAGVGHSKPAEPTIALHCLARRQMHKLGLMKVVQNRVFEKMDVLTTGQDQR